MVQSIRVVVWLRDTFTVWVLDGTRQVLRTHLLHECVYSEQNLRDCEEGIECDTGVTSSKGY